MNSLSFSTNLTYSPDHPTEPRQQYKAACVAAGHGGNQPLTEARQQETYACWQQAMGDHNRQRRVSSTKLLVWQQAMRTRFWQRGAQQYTAACVAVYHEDQQPPEAHQQEELLARQQVMGNHQPFPVVQAGR